MKVAALEGVLKGVRPGMSLLVATESGFGGKIAFDIIRDLVDAGCLTIGAEDQRRFNLANPKARGWSGETFRVEVTGGLVGENRQKFIDLAAGLDCVRRLPLDHKMVYEAVNQPAGTKFRLVYSPSVSSICARDILTFADRGWLYLDEDTRQALHLWDTTNRQPDFVTLVITNQFKRKYFAGLLNGCLYSISKVEDE